MANNRPRRSFGRKIVDELKELVRHLKRGLPLSAKYKVTRVRRDRDA